MMKFALPLIFMAAAGTAIAQDTSGFYLGGDLSAFDADFENLTLTGDGTAIGLHAGYRYSLSATTFLEAEVFAADLNGETDTGGTDFENYYGATAGFGAYVADAVSLSVFAGFAAVDSSSAATGDVGDDGSVVGVSAGYDVTPKDTISLRLSRITVDGLFGDIDADVISLRYSRRF